MCLGLIPSLAAAQYSTRASVTTNGGITFTGNSLGLDGAQNQNGQGTRGAIGTFATTDTSQRDNVPAPGGGVTQFPFGTTNDWTQNSSAAVLRVPAGARVVRAELIWGGTFAGNTSADNVSAFINDPIVFSTPLTTTTVAPDSTTSRQTGALTGTGACSTASGSTGCYYVRTADVTALVAAAGPGTYVTGRVPATQGTTDNNNPAAGWTLAVIYEDFTKPIRNLTLFLGLEISGGAAASVSGFCTPPSGPVAGRLAVSALEGDASITGDQLLFGPTASLTNANRVSGPRNPPTNFFSGQILDDAGSLDTTGTFGTRNHSPGTPVDGARQGWDITQVDASAQLRNNQTAAFAQGSTTGDNYRITTLALAIDIGAPRFRNADTKTVDRVTAVVGDVLTYTVVLDNSTGTTQANNVVFFDTLPAGTTYVPGSFTVVGGSSVPGDPVSGFALGTIAAGQAMTVRFQAQVTSIPPGPNPHLRNNRARWTFDYVSCAGQPTQTGAAESNTVTTTVPVADLAISKTFLTPPAVPGAPVQYRIIVTNLGPSPAPGALVTESGTTPALAGGSWTCTSSSGSCSAPTGTGGAFTSPVTLPPGGSATFTVTGTLPASTPSGTLANTATITAPAGVPDVNAANNTAVASSPIIAQANLRLTKSGPATGSLGSDLTYTLTVTNLGPSDAFNVLVTDPAPTGLNPVSVTGPCSIAPGCALPAGASSVVTVTFNVPPAYSGPDPIVNTATVTSAAPDPDTTNNTARASTSLLAPVVDLVIVKTDGVTQNVPGITTVYTLTVTNNGPASAINARVQDLFDPSTFSDPRWQCVANGSSSCTTSGVQLGDVDTLITVDPGAGNSVVLTTNATILPGVRGSLTNTATVTAATGVTDSSTANNSSTDTDTLVSVADLSITKTGPPAIVRGTTATYTIVAANAGPSTILDLEIGDLPVEGPVLGTTPVRAELIQSVTPPSGVTCENRGLVFLPTGQEFVGPVCTIPSLAPGETRSIVVTLAIPSDYVGSVDDSAITNVAALLKANFDGDPDIGDQVGVATSTLTSNADVGVTKIGPASIVAGGTASFFLTISNAGPTTATNVVIEDPVPAGLTIAGGDGPCASGFPCTLPALAPGQVTSTRIDLSVPRDFPGSTAFVNTATVRSDVADADAANNSSSTSTLVVSERADLQVEKIGPSVVLPGGLIEYTARVTNLGPGPAIDVTSADVIPGGMTLVDGTPPPAPTTCTVPAPGVSNLISCVTPVLPAGGVLEFRYVLQASADLVPGAVVTNIASASSPTPDLHPLNDRAQVVTRVAAPTDADVQVTKTDATDPVIAGATATYVLTVRNNGPAPASAVTVTDTLPAGFAFVSATPSQGSCAPAVCSLGTLAAGATATVTVVATTSATGRVTNVATVTAAEVDPVPTNNTASEITVVSLTTQADLEIQKEGPSTLRPGDSGFFFLRIVNRGPAAAHNVVIDDPLPAGELFVTNAGDCVTAFPCLFEQLEPGQVVTITSTFTIDPTLSTPGVLTNTATVLSATTDDPDPIDNSATATVAVYADPAADLEIVKGDSPDPVAAGSSLSYQLNVSNHGPSPASGVVVTDPLPAGVTLISATPTQGTCSGTTTVTCDLGTMPSGSNVDIGILATAPQALPVTNPMINTASVASTSPVDPQPANNTATQSTTVVARANVTILKTGPPTVVPGQTFAYTITVQNAGPSQAVNVVVTDVLPSGLSLVSASAPCQSGFPCVLGVMPAGTAIAITANVRLAADYAGPATLVNTAEVTTATELAPPGIRSSTVTTAVGPASADVSVEKQAQAATVLPGGQIVFTTTVRNAGPSTATGVSLTAPPPEGVTFVGNTGGCTTPFPCALGTLAPGESRSIVTTFNVPANYAGPAVIANPSTVSSTTADPNLANNTATASVTIGALSDIALVKTVDVQAPSPGSVVTFTVTAANQGPSAATGVQVIDQLPAGLMLLSSTPSQGAYDPSTGIWQIGALANGGAATLTMAARVALPSGLVNVATKIAADQPDPNTSNNSAGVALTAQAVADVQVQITADRTSVNVGEGVTLTVTLRNAGPNDATAILTRVALPAGLSVSAAALTATPSIGTFDPSTNEWLVPALPVTGTATLTLGASISTAGAHLVTATKIAQTQLDPVRPNDSSGIVINGLAADIQVIKTASERRVTLGQPITFTVVATNNGPSDATGVVLRDALPAGLAFISATASQGVFDPVTGLWNIGNMPAAGASNVATLTLQTVVSSAGAITNTASLARVTETDQNPANDSSALLLQSSTSDLAVDLNLIGDLGAVGTRIRMFVEISSVGAASSTGRITFTLSLPPEIDYLAPPNGWLCTPAGQTVSCWADGHELAPGVRIAPVVDTILVRPLTAPAWVTVAIANAADVNPANNLASLRVDSTLVVDPADLAIAQRVTPGVGSRGQTFAVTVDVLNRGPDPATATVTQHVVADGLTVISAIPSSGACEVKTQTICTLGRVASGARSSVTLRVRADAIGVFKVVSSVMAVEDDPRLQDNQTSIAVMVAPDLGSGGTSGGSRPPFGYVDLPADGAVVSGAVAITGWALDDLGVARVRIFRDPVALEPPGARVFIADATRVRGARPDVEAAYAVMPQADRAGWGVLVLTNMLPNRGNGTFRIHAIAEDDEGQQAVLGSRTIVADNASAILPFGTLDTPLPGETISGSYVNFGWALTPAPGTIPVDGSTITVFIDGQAAGGVAYNHYRPDVAALFPDYLNAGGAVGHHIIDSTLLANGMHTISWSVTDDRGRTAGIGSRYFWVANGIATTAGANEMVVSATGSATASDGRVHRVLIRRLERLELDVHALDTERRCGAPSYSGHEQVSGESRPLPVGSTLDATRGVFAWQPGPGFVGEYRLQFTRSGCDGTTVLIPVNVVISNAAAAVGASPPLERPEHR